MSFSSIIGQSLAVDLCQRWVTKETTHPLLFFGPEGVGKRTLAIEVAKALNCSAAKKPCNADACLSCKKIAAGNHPDVRVISLFSQAAERGEPIEKQQSLRMETIQNERRRLLQSAGEGRWKVSILDDAERLTADAANALLKILEEPPEHTALFLLTPFRDRLFQTILSRCQPIRFRPLSDEEMQKCLAQQGVAEEDRIRLIELALGSPGRALHLGRAEQIEAIREAEDLWESLAHKKAGEIVSGPERRTKANRLTRPDVEERLSHLLVPAWRALHSGYMPAQSSVRLIEQAQIQLRHNVQPGLVYDNLLLQLATLRRQQ